jgi:hypothetical protein
MRFSRLILLAAQSNPIASLTGEGRISRKKAQKAQKPTSPAKPRQNCPKTRHTHYRRADIPVRSNARKSYGSETVGTRSPVSACCGQECPRAASIASWPLSIITWLETTHKCLTQRMRTYRFLT